MRQSGSQRDERMMHVRRVEDEEASGREDAANFGGELLGAVDVFRDHVGGDEVEEVVGVGEGGAVADKLFETGAVWAVVHGVAAVSNFATANEVVLKADGVTNPEGEDAFAATDVQPAGVVADESVEYVLVAKL